MKSWFSNLSDNEQLQKAAADWRSNTGPISYEWLVTIGAMGLVATGLLVWAYYFRKRRTKPHYHYPHGRRSKSAEPAPEQTDAHASEHRHRRRRRRHHRHRNPTRAETGGLPSVDPSPSSEPTA